MAFAKADDVAKRLGRALTESEKTSYEALLLLSSAVIEEAIEKSEAAFEGNAPSLLGLMAVELALRGAANPKGLESAEKQLGQYSHAERYRETRGADIMLTVTEELMLRRAVWGGTTESQRVRGHIDDIWESLVGAGS